MLFAFLCSLTVYAQDVIVKKDGNTIVCRVVEVGQTEVVYKRWTELQGNNYVMNLSDIASIHYENGQKKNFGTTTESNSPLVLNNIPQNIDDGALLAMASKTSTKSKTKRLKRIGWIGGAILLGAGIPCLVVGVIGEEEYYYGFGYYEVNPGLTAAGAVLSAGGIALTTGCLVRSHRLNKKVPYNVQNIPVWQNEFKLKNQSTLSTDICAINDGRLRTSTLGLGISYNF